MSHYDWCECFFIMRHAAINFWGYIKPISLPILTCHILNVTNVWSALKLRLLKKWFSKIFPLNPHKLRFKLKSRVAMNYQRNLYPWIETWEREIILTVRVCTNYLFPFSTFMEVLPFTIAIILATKPVQCGFNQHVVWGFGHWKMPSFIILLFLNP